MDGDPLTNDTQLGAAAPPAPAQTPAAAMVPTLGNASDAHRFFSDPDAMVEMAHIAAKYRDPNFMTWLEMGHRAVRENAIEATQRLLADDGPGALKAFNKSGRYTDASSATKNADGTWTISRKNGDAVNVNPQVLMASFLSPKDYSEHMNKQADNARLDKAQASTENYQQGLLKHYERSDQSQSDLRDARAEKARTDFGHQLELIGVRGKAAADLADTHAAAARSLAELKANQAPMIFRQDLTKELFKAAQTDQERASVPDTVDLAVRKTYTQVMPRVDGKGFDLVTIRGDGLPVALGSFADQASAEAAKQAFVTGKQAPAPTIPVPAKVVPPKPAIPARTLPPLGVSAEDVWGAAPNQRRALGPSVPGSTWADVGSY